MCNSLKSTCKHRIKNCCCWSINSVVINIALMISGVSSCEIGKTGLNLKVFKQNVQGVHLKTATSTLQVNSRAGTLVMSGAAI